MYKDPVHFSHHEMVTIIKQLVKSYMHKPVNTFIISLRHHTSEMHDNGIIQNEDNND